MATCSSYLGERKMYFLGKTSLIQGEKGDLQWRGGGCDPLLRGFDRRRRGKKGEIPHSLWIMYCQGPFLPSLRTIWGEGEVAEYISKGKKEGKDTRYHIKKSVQTSAKRS